jgi:hypothetical protein
LCAGLTRLRARVSSLGGFPRPFYGLLFPAEFFGLFLRRNLFTRSRTRTNINLKHSQPDRG